MDIQFYIKHTGLYDYNGNWDVIFLCGSIVCFETEIDNIIKIKKKKNTNFLLWYLSKICLR